MKISGKKFSKFLTDILAKMSQNIFAYLSISEHSASFFSFLDKKNTYGQGVLPPPPYTDWSVTYRRVFFLRLPLHGTIAYTYMFLFFQLKIKQFRVVSAKLLILLFLFFWFYGPGVEVVGGGGYVNHHEIAFFVWA